MKLASDKKGRAIILMRGDQIVFCRYPDMDKETKDYMESVFSDVSVSSVEKFRDFLDYKEDEDEFCA